MKRSLLPNAQLIMKPLIYKPPTKILAALRVRVEEQADASKLLNKTTNVKTNLIGR